MKPTQRTVLPFYQNLGKLFYAIAAADRSVKDIEIEALQRCVKREWLAVDSVEDTFGTDAAFQIEIVFNWLDGHVEDAETAFDDFVVYYKSHKGLFTKEIQRIIHKTAGTIADAFSGINKSELVLLGKLNLLFNSKL